MTIQKTDLQTGAYYKGECRNATVARWDGTAFRHRRFKFGGWFIETIRCPEDDQRYDTFHAAEKIEEPANPEERIALD